ncbi:outer membrane protein assembly factor [Bacteroidales bacterium OttesenSCG-928-J16]|nr:outer membrane protein assembly factor [Bacteroidales bacterium OttesenSCG-928-J16]
MKKYLMMIFLAAAFVPFCRLSAQAKGDAELKDIWQIIFGEKKKDSLKVRKERAVEFGALPYVAASPSSGFKFGAVTNIHYRLGKDSITKKSAQTVSLAYTTKKQLYFYLRGQTYLPRNSWTADIDVRYNNNNENTYGLGAGTPKSDEWLLYYSTVRANITMMKRVVEGFYAGAGINYNYYFNIHGKDSLPDYYLAYNESLGIAQDQSTAAGFNLAAMYDSRDNIINAYKGIMARVVYSFMFDILGSDQAWQQVWAEFRAFQRLTSNNRHRLAFWTYASMITTGEVPYMNLPAVGYDLFGKSSRGYAIGRFRGDKLLYGEIEYRASITRNDLLGAVAFVNATTVSTPDASSVVQKVHLFDYVEPGFGVGLRLKLNRFSRTNISVDYAFGRKSQGFYLDISETF